MIGIQLVCTNAYSALGSRFINRFLHYYKGDQKIKFFVAVDDLNFWQYVPQRANLTIQSAHHSNWVDATNSKFTNMLRIRDRTIDYLYYFDVDTNIVRPFTEDWFLGDFVAGEHWTYWGNRTGNIPLDRNPKSVCYVPIDREDQIYYYGAFFGGKTNQVLKMCDELLEMQQVNKKINYEPPWNDESYLNYYFNVLRKPTKSVQPSNFQFQVSDKGGLNIERQPNFDVSEILEAFQQNKEKLIDIRYGEVVIC